MTTTGTAPQVLLAVAVAVCSTVLAVSVVAKLRGRTAFAGFVAAVVQLSGLPRPLARPVAVAVVATEAVLATGLAAALVVPSTLAAPVLAVAAALFAGFALVLARAVARHVPTSCHCFGASSDPVSVGHVVRAALLCAVAVAGTAVAPAAPADGLLGLPPAALLVAGAVAAGCVACLVLLDDLAWLLWPGRAPAIRRKR